MMLRSLLFFLICIGINPLITFSQNESNFSVYFESGSAVLAEKEIKKIQESLDTTDQYRVLRIEIEGYCDSTGASAANMLLSQKRAHFVKNNIENRADFLDVPIAAIGRGELQNHPEFNLETALKNNRRVDILYTIDPTISEDVEVPNIPIQKAEPEISEKVQPEAPEAPKLEIANLEKGSTTVLNGIIFVPGSSEFLPEATSGLEQLRAEMQANPARKIKILGHICCDTGGNDGWDKTTGKKNLSVARALAVHDYLIANGISKKRLSYKGLKGKFPLGGKNYLDRRVEILVLE